MRRFPVFAALLLALSGIVPQASADDSSSPRRETSRTGPFWDALSAYQKGDYAHAIPLFQAAAAQGNGAAEFYLGAVYEHGEGMLQDFKMAVTYYTEAAEAGNAQGQYRLGALYEYGEGVAQDYLRAYMWFDVSSSSGKYFGVNRRESVAAKMTPQQIATARTMANECRQQQFKECGAE